MKILHTINVTKSKQIGRLGQMQSFPHYHKHFLQYTGTKKKRERESFQISCASCTVRTSGEEERTNGSSRFSIITLTSCLDQKWSTLTLTCCDMRALVMRWSGPYFNVPVKQLTEQHTTPIIMIGNNYSIGLLKPAGEEENRCQARKDKVIRSLRIALFYF